jgi:hypothetical protein
MTGLFMVGKILYAACVTGLITFFALVVVPESAHREAHREHIVQEWNREHGYGP